MGRNVVFGLWGFTFGTVGLYLLALLTLTAPSLEAIVAPLMWPGRAAAEALAEADALAVVLFTLLNGIAYAFLFILAALAFNRLKEE